MTVAAPSVGAPYAPAEQTGAADAFEVVAVVPPAVKMQASADLARARAALGPALAAAYIHVNHAKRSQFEGAEGETLEFEASAPLRPELVSLVSPAMNGQIMVALVTGVAGADGGATTTDASSITSEQMREAGLKLAALPEESAAYAHADIVDEASGYDAHAWKPVAGRGSSVGLYRATAPLGEGNADQHNFFLIALVGETPIGKAAHEHFEQCAARGMSVGAYVQDERTRRLRSLAQRNAARLLSDAATLVGLLVVRGHDLAASRAPLATRPLVALPQLHAEFNVFGALPTPHGHGYGRTEPHVAYYDHSQDVFNARGGAIVQLDARVGFYVLQSNVSERFRFSNAAANSVPLHTGYGDNARARLQRGVRIVGLGGASNAETAARLAAQEKRALDSDTRALLKTLVPGAETFLLEPIVVALSRAREL